MHRISLNQGRSSVWSLAGVAVLGHLAFAVACGESNATPAAPEGAGAAQAKKAEPSSLEPLRIKGGSAPREPRPTVDGVEIVMANPSQAPADLSKRGPAADPAIEPNLVREPTTPDPLAGQYTLEQAVQGLGTDGGLVAEIGTDFGTLFCDLYADRAPRTVANFIGLVRGQRPFWDARAGSWVQRPYYRGTPFHRVIPGYLIQGGDYLGDGSGTVGYTIPDELHESLRHDRAGQLCMANDQPNKGGAQFFITDGAAARLDGSYTIFGQCRPTDLVSQIARVPQVGAPTNRPLTPIVITRMNVRRVRGGAAAATVSLPALPPEERNPRNASDPPGSAHPFEAPSGGLHDGHGH